MRATLAGCNDQRALEPPLPPQSAGYSLRRDGACDRRKSFYKVRRGIRWTRRAALRTGIFFLLFLLVGARARGGREPLPWMYGLFVGSGFAVLAVYPYGLRFMSWLAVSDRGFSIRRSTACPSSIRTTARRRSSSSARCMFPRRSFRRSKFLDRGQRPFASALAAPADHHGRQHGPGVAGLLFCKQDGS